MLRPTERAGRHSLYNSIVLTLALLAPTGARAGEGGEELLQALTGRQQGALAIFKRLALGMDEAIRIAGEPAGSSSLALEEALLTHSPGITFVSARIVSTLGCIQSIPGCGGPTRVFTTTAALVDAEDGARLPAGTYVLDLDLREYPVTRYDLLSSEGRVILRRFYGPETYCPDVVPAIFRVMDETAVCFAGRFWRVED